MAFRVVRRTPRSAPENASPEPTRRTNELTLQGLTLLRQGSGGESLAQEQGLKGLVDDFCRGAGVLSNYGRLMRWRFRRSWQTRQCPVPGRRGITIAVALAVLGSCQLVSQGSGGGAEEGEAAGLGVRPPELSKKRGASARQGPWAYVLPVDHGVRADHSGKGHFRAPRFHGEHNGIDLLAPLGTPVFAACEGRAMAGASKSFGRWIHLVCPIPKELVRSGNPHASFFYAHLQESKLPHNRWVPVGKGDTIGAVGKTGNAAGGNIQPHLHLELIIQASLRAALDERHLGNDQSSVPEAVEFLRSIDERCLEPHGFQPKSGALRRARRFDPFVALTCLSPDKPSFVPAPKPLDFASSAWSQFYLATGFNVDRGPDALLVAGR